MKENVGLLDQKIRKVLGPSLVMVGYTLLGGYKGRTLGLLSMMAGVSATDSALTRKCPMNRLLGIDTRSPAQIAEDRLEALESAARDVFELPPSAALEETVLVETSPGTLQ